MGGQYNESTDRRYGGWWLGLSALCFGRLGRRGLFYCFNQGDEPVCELNCSGDSYDGLHHAMQKRRAVVVLVNCCARSGRAFFNALVFKREEVTAL